MTTNVYITLQPSNDHLPPPSRPVWKAMLKWIVTAFAVGFATHRVIRDWPW